MTGLFHPRALSRLADKPFVWGMLGVCLVYLALGFLHAQGLGTFKAGDESRHARYAIVLAEHGRLPTLEETKAAKHPPLYYWLIGDLLHEGEVRGELGTAVKQARMVSVLFGALALLYVGLLARALVPDRPEVAVLSAATLAVMPSYPNLAVVGNDALGLLCQLAITHACIVVVLRGPRIGTLLPLAFWVMVGGLVRIQAALLLPGGVIALVLASLCHARGSRWRRVGVGVALAGGLVALGLLAWGWFYHYNSVRFGEISGSEILLERNPKRHPRGFFLGLMLDPDIWWMTYDYFWGRLAGQQYPRGALLGFGRLLLAASALGTLAWAWRERARLARGSSPARRYAWLVGVGIAGSIVCQLFYYYSRGGVVNPRYVFGATWLLTLSMAVGLTFTRGVVVPVLGAFSVLSFGLTLNLKYVAHLARSTSDFAFEAALDRESVPEPMLWSFALLVAVVLGSALVLAAVVQASSRGASPYRSPTC